MAEEPAAPYQALYRRFRPQRFSDVLGQEHVTRALKAAVRDGKVVHAYLFSGPRGTGKTSTARILAMALNCEHPIDGEPDGVCPSCVAIRQGSSLDVQELDSATNRGIDEMRDLLGRVALGTPGRWKVYIVDEVHQMTSAASSALLKTLEEPPAHVIFVLATTDPQKVMPTIRSRTQHFEFRLLSTEVLMSLLKDIADQADLNVPPAALDLVVRKGHGSARDALSVLDQVAAAGGAPEEETVVAELVDAIADRDAGAVLEEVAQAMIAGLDARRLGTEILEHLRNGFLATRARDLVMLPPEAAARAEAQAHRLGPASIVRAMETVGQALIDMREAADPRITLEVALVRLTAPEADHSMAALLERVERLERGSGERAAPSAAPSASAPGPVAGKSGDTPRSPGPPPPMPGPRSERSALGAHRQTSGPPPTPPGVVPERSPATPPPPPGPPPSAPRPEPKAASTVTGAPMPTREELTLAWGDKVLPGLRPAVKVYVASGRFLSVSDEGAVFAVPDRGLLRRAESGHREVEAALADHFGRPIPLRLVLDESPGAVATTSPASSPDHDDDPVDFDIHELEDAPAAAMTPEQRLMDAFPGAEEVTQ